MNKFDEVYNKIISEMKEDGCINKENVRHKFSHITSDGKIDYSDIFASTDDDQSDIKEINEPQKEIQNQEPKNEEPEYKAIFSFDEGTEIKGDNFIDVKKAAYKYATDQSDRTEIKIFDPSGNLVLATLYSKEGFENGRCFKKIKGNEF